MFPVEALMVVLLTAQADAPSSAEQSKGTEHSIAECHMQDKQHNKLNVKPKSKL